MAILVKSSDHFPLHTYFDKYRIILALLSLLGFLTFQLEFHPLLLLSLPSFLILPIKFRSLTPVVPFLLHQPFLFLQSVGLLSFVFHLYHIMTQYIVSIFLSLLLVQLLYFLWSLLHLHSYSPPFSSMSDCNLSIYQVGPPFRIKFL